MVLAAAFGLALGWGLVRGGRLTGFSELPLRHGWIALVALGLQIYPTYFPDAPGIRPFGPAVLVLLLSYLLLLLFVWENRSLPGIWLLGAGLASNLVVMLLNGGYMPVTREALLGGGYASQAAGASIGSHLFGSKDVLLAAGQVRGWILSDIFVIPPYFPIHGIFSIGDVLIAAGIFLIIQYAMSKPSIPLQMWSR